MVDLLLKVIFDALLEKYSIQGTEDFIVELDSSTEGKYNSCISHWFVRNVILHFVKYRVAKLLNASLCLTVIIWLSVCKHRV